MISKIKIYGLNNINSILKIQNILENIYGVSRVFIELNSSTAYISTNCEIDENILSTEIINAGFDI